MKYLALLLIRFYQKRISPYKGFRCAHAALHQGVSCSEAVKHIIEEHGVFCGYRLVKMRFTDCKGAYQQLHENEANKSKKNDKPKKTIKINAALIAAIQHSVHRAAYQKKGVIYLAQPVIAHCFNLNNERLICCYFK
ncbi:membrane protein insertion efficiency factor YidD [Pseudoalteromonas sp. NEC-BIFX-2020_002]|uniref:membrane protein insertion efficiency factor YidD n=1 Tax=Pseudoalteromonas sp. NEC-BIFX-2020_002 TaxID=2732353 RepID=UPI0014775DE3|nr:membrane protein insertion efficiency factor YidD [Pseudoalteromonas sp. NEC-BIFX-2020_002]NNG45178.1 membrane protein insertion efficiency factor YidD [Pseudoalteromonas sp. NEC-BIFX-2020_002]